MLSNFRSLLLTLSLSSIFCLSNLHAAEGLFGGDRVLEPRLKSQVEAEEKRKREEQRKRLDAKQAQEGESQTALLLRQN